MSIEACKGRVHTSSLFQSKKKSLIDLLTTSALTKDSYELALEVHRWVDELTGDEAIPFGLEFSMDVEPVWKMLAAHAIGLWSERYAIKENFLKPSTSADDEVGAVLSTACTSLQSIGCQSGAERTNNLHFETVYVCKQWYNMHGIFARCESDAASLSQEEMVNVLSLGRWSVINVWRESMGVHVSETAAPLADAGWSKLNTHFATIQDLWALAKMQGVVCACRVFQRRVSCWILFCWSQGTSDFAQASPCGFCLPALGRVTSRPSRPRCPSPCTLPCRTPWRRSTRPSPAART